MVSRFGKTMALVLVLVALSGAAGRAAAQSWAVTPYIGYFFALGDVISEDDAGDAISQQSTVAFGGRLLRMFNAAWGAEFSVGYAGSGVEDSDDEEDASITMFSARLVRQFSPTFMGGGGLAYVTRGGTFWEDIDGTSDIGANLFLAYLFPMGERMKVRIEIEDYISSAGFDVGGFETDGQLQNDLVLSGGVMIPF